jgi:hypothetical protein
MADYMPLGRLKTRTIDERQARDGHTNTALRSNSLLRTHVSQWNRAIRTGNNNRTAEYVGYFDRRFSIQLQCQCVPVVE